MADNKGKIMGLMPYRYISTRAVHVFFSTYVPTRSTNSIPHALDHVSCLLTATLYTVNLVSMTVRWFPVKACNWTKTRSPWTMTLSWQHTTY